ncbi:MAG: NAD-dependent epimerase/dehydratase family protein [Candidatus Omnitrophota bacterium]
MSFWQNKKVLVTGGAGFIGSCVVEILLKQGAVVTVAGNEDLRLATNLRGVIDDIKYLKTDLRQLIDCKNACEGNSVVLNLAAIVGGINFNKQHPGSIFRDNILISTNTLEAARICNVERFLVTSSACIYPHTCKIPTPESEGFVDTPEPTNDGYGWAKRMAEFQADAYHREFGINIAIVRPYNAYGPRDCFDPERAHVIPSLIRRIFANENPLIVWGDGQQSRSFLYVTDLARGILEVAEKYAVCDPLNLGSEEEIKISDLVDLIVKLSGKQTKVVFDTTKPCGQIRRKCDVTKAREKIGFEARVSLENGITKTIEWYLKQNKPA